MSHLYGYRPSLAGNVIGIVVFSALTGAQILLRFRTKDLWMFISFGVAGGGLEVAGYICRTISSASPESVGPFVAQLVCLLVAPAFMAIGIYDQLPKTSIVFGKWFIPASPRYLVVSFIVMDVISRTLQGVGAGLGGAVPKGFAAGRVLIITGVSLQLFTLMIFSGLFFGVCMRLSNDKSHWDPRFAENRKKPLFKFWHIATSLSLTLLIVRTIYRVVSISVNKQQPEVVFLILDGLMIALCMASMTIIYPNIAHGELPKRGSQHFPMSTC